MASEKSPVRGAPALRQVAGQQALGGEGARPDGRPGELAVVEALRDVPALAESAMPGRHDEREPRGIRRFGDDGFRGHRSRGEGRLVARTLHEAGASGAPVVGSRDAGPHPLPQRCSARQLESADAKRRTAGGIDDEPQAALRRPPGEEPLTASGRSGWPDPDLIRERRRPVEHRRARYEHVRTGEGRLAPGRIVPFEGGGHRGFPEPGSLRTVVRAAQADDIGVEQGLRVLDAHLECDTAAGPDAESVAIPENRDHGLRTLPRSLPSSAGGRRSAPPRSGP